MYYEELFNGFNGTAAKRYIDDLTDDLGLGNIGGPEWTVCGGWDGLTVYSAFFLFDDRALTFPIEVTVTLIDARNGECPVTIDGKAYEKLTVEDAADKIREAAKMAERRAV